MPVAKKLIDEIDAFAARNPGNQNSTNALRKAVQRIDTEFSGETRNMLLCEARLTFTQQIKMLETTEGIMESLAKLQANQERLVEALKKLATHRPEGVTLH